jgi:UDP-N-acetylglucosamine--N-acetylmuramyl-(pentapeptide) pyrophosphoryl-undecaprenol N-acetylglucosamine transferase
MQAIAEHLRARGLRADELRFVGSRRGQEATLLKGDVELTLLAGRGIRRSLSPSALVDNLVAMAGLAGALAQAVTLMIRWRPRVVVSVGGYASLPASVAAVLTGRPLVLVELDATPGAALRVVRRFARRRCTAFPASDPRAVTTGAPLREAIESISRERTRLSVRDAGGSVDPRWTLVVMTGSLGARSVNEAVLELARRWRARSDVRLVHVTGERDYESLRARWAPVPDDQLEYEQVPFADMVELWARADLAVCRAGATTVAELAFLGIPSVLVPLPGAPGDHQSHNALALARAGGAVVVADSPVSADALATAIAPLLDEDRLRAMSAGARSLGRGGAAAAIAAVILEVAA